MTETDREHISIREMLEKNGMDLSDSVYSDSAMVDFVVPASGTWKLKKESLEDSEYSRIIQYRKTKKALSERCGAEDLERRMDEISGEMHRMLEEGGSREEPAFITLGKQKKTLRKERKAILEKASGEACLSLFGKELPDGVLHSCCFNESLWAFGITALNQSYSTRGLDAVAGVNICSTLSNVFCVFFIAAGENCTFLSP